MPSRELSRLQRLKVSNMNEARLRTELTKSIKNFQAELNEKDKAEKNVQAELRVLSQDLRKATQREKKLSTENARQAAKLDQLEAQVSNLRKLAQDKPVTIDITSAMRNRVTELQMENVQLTARLKAVETLSEKLQQERETARKDNVTVKTQTLFQKFSEEISAASKVIPAEFEIDDVEIDVRGALGTEGESIVMGLDAKQQSHPEGATRLKFNLRRRAQITVLDNGDE